MRSLDGDFGETTYVRKRSIDDILATYLPKEEYAGYLRAMIVKTAIEGPLSNCRDYLTRLESL